MPGINQKWWKGGAGSQIMFHLWNFLSSSFLVNFIYHGNHILTKNLFEWCKHPVSSQSAVNTYNMCSFCKTAVADMASENITSCWGCNAPWLCLDGIVCQASQVGCVQKGSAPLSRTGLAGTKVHHAGCLFHVVRQRECVLALACPPVPEPASAAVLSRCHILPTQARS